MNNSNLIIELIKNRPMMVPNILFYNYKKLNLTEEELIILILIINESDESSYDPNKIALDLDMDKFKVMEIISNLCDKRIISIDIKKNGHGKSEEYISLDLLYSKLLGLAIDKSAICVDEEDDSIYGIFEKEFGRTLSPMEYEIIKGWVSSNINNELIIEALKEAVYNGATGLRYIEKILYEWKRKNIKTKEDVIKDKERFRKKKGEDVDVFDYNWLDE